MLLIRNHVIISFPLKRTRFKYCFEAKLHCVLELMCVMIRNPSGRTPHSDYVAGAISPAYVPSIPPIRFSR